jgi:hypothetical protein
MNLIRFLAFFSAIVALGGARDAGRVRVPDVAPSTSACLCAAHHSPLGILPGASPLPELGSPPTASRAPAFPVLSVCLASLRIPERVASLSHGYGFVFSGLSPPAGT